MWKPNPAAGAVLPRHLFGYVWQVSGWHQLGLAALSVLVFLLSAVPLELQRRIVNDAIGAKALESILWLALAYAGVALTEGSIKLMLNVYRGWVSESAVRSLRSTIFALAGVQPEESGDARAEAEGTEISMIVSEAVPIGGFIGISFSEPLLQGGILLSVFGYLMYLEPRIALFSIAVFSPQLIFVPLLQGAINRRARKRIQTLRDVSGGIVADPLGGSAAHPEQQARFDSVFDLNMGIYKLKFSMNFLMNLMHHLGVACALGIGGWYAVKGQIEVGTVVAFVSGLAKVNDPWGDVVNWFREMMEVRIRYRLVAEAASGR
ncbi:MAG: ABC transporter ATP-binding protein [Betaproteobacteria bacterium]|nr:ABC transporter ATP-binding protein [Betaproteobacteria bacterium]